MLKLPKIENKKVRCAIIAIVIIACSITGFFIGKITGNASKSNENIETMVANETISVNETGNYLFEIAYVNTDQNVIFELYDEEGNIVKNDGEVINEYAVGQSGFIDVSYTKLPKGTYTIKLTGNYGDCRISVLDADILPQTDVTEENVTEESQTENLANNIEE